MAIRSGTQAVSVPTKAKAKAKLQAKGKGASAAQAKGGRKAAKKAKGAGNGEKIAQDPFGCRVGTKLAKVNGMLTKKPLAMKQITANMGDGQTYFNHLHRMVEKGFVSQGKNGFALTAAGAKAMGRK